MRLHAKMLWQKKVLKWCELFTLEMQINEIQN